MFLWEDLFTFGTWVSLDFAVPMTWSRFPVEQDWDGEVRKGLSPAKKGSRAWAEGVEEWARKRGRKPPRWEQLSDGEQRQRWVGRLLCEHLGRVLNKLIFRFHPPRF